jgi:hypothetical protein
MFALTRNFPYMGLLATRKPGKMSVLLKISQNPRYISFPVKGEACSNKWAKNPSMKRERSIELLSFCFLVYSRKADIVFDAQGHNTQHSTAQHAWLKILTVPLRLSHR